MTRRSAAFPVVEVALATDHSFLVRAAGCSESATWNVGGPGGGGGGRGRCTRDTDWGFEGCHPSKNKGSIGDSIQAVFCRARRGS